MAGFILVLLYVAVLGFVVSAARQLLLSWKGGASRWAKNKFPGPRLYPIVGRIHDLPRFSIWLKLKDWADIYGPIYQFRALSQTFIIVSDEQMAEELLVKRGNIYSGRPQIRSLIGHKQGPEYVALMDRNDCWKMQRKWVHAAMAEAHKHRFYGHIEKEATRYLALLLLDPVRFLTHTREYCGRVMCRLTWDDATLGPDTGASANETLHCMSVSGPITNTATPLWHLPLALNPWKRHELRRAEMQRNWWLSSYRVARARMMRGDLPADTWAYRYFEQLMWNGKDVGMEQQDEDQEVFAACMLGFFNLVGVITISGPLEFFLMAIALHPEWQRRAQEEIDRVCGERMPTAGDFADLPTVRACLKETLRWRSGVPLGVPHQAEQDDEYRGVTIKKGTIILACEWNINRVESKYPDSESYRPERWLEPGSPTYQEPLSRYPNLREGHAMHTFGWGRRTCLGQQLADDETLVFAAAVLWGFDLAPATCPRTGAPVPIDTHATNSHVILEPDPFRLNIRPRSEGRAARILKEYEAVRADLRV